MAMDTLDLLEAPVRAPVRSRAPKTAPRSLRSVLAKATGAAPRLWENADWQTPYAHDEYPFLWHGTTTEHLDSILANGLLPEHTQGMDHVCFGLRSHIAHFWGRVHLTMGSNSKEHRVVLLRVPKATLDMDLLCIESGYINAGPHGSDLPHAAKGSQQKWERCDWKGFANAFGAVGYTGPVAIDRSMLIDTDEVNAIGPMADLLAEFSSGNPGPNPTR